MAFPGDNSLKVVGGVGPICLAHYETCCMLACWCFADGASLAPISDDPSASYPPAALLVERNMARGAWVRRLVRHCITENRDCIALSRLPCALSTQRIVHASFENWMLSCGCFFVVTTTPICRQASTTMLMCCNSAVIDTRKFRQSTL